MARLKTAERNQVMSQTRQLLLEAAEEEFAREGYVGANINRISKAAGFAKGTIYNYFPSKRALMLALIDEIANAHIDFVVERVQQEQDPVRKLECFFEAGFAFVSHHLAQSRVLATTLYGPDAEFKRVLGEAYQPLFQFISQDIIAAGIAQGIFRQVDPYATAVLLMTIYLGTGTQVDEDGRIWLDPRQVADFTLNALRP